MKPKSKANMTFGILIVMGMIYYYFGIYNPEIYEQIEGLEVHFIDVGQGDAILIRTENGSSMLIDAGENERDVANYLRSLDVDTIQYVVGTHPHSDHIGGIPYVLENFHVENILLPNVSHTTSVFERMIDAIMNNNLQITFARSGDVFYLDEAKFTVIAPVKDTYTNLNNYSVVLKMDYAGRTFMFTGDAEQESEMDMLRTGINLRSDILKVGHHGSSTSTTKEFLDAVDPLAAVISVGIDNTYGHPNQQVLDMLNTRDINVYRTDENGNILIIVQEDGKMEVRYVHN